MSTFFGSDTACVTDLSLIDKQITGPRRLIGERVARRLQCPRGALASVGGNPNGGFDVRQFVKKKLGPTDIATAQSQIQFEVVKDEQVLSCVARMTMSGSTLTISLSLVSSAGPFTLTLNVGDLTVDAVFDFST